MTSVVDRPAKQRHGQAPAWLLPAGVHVWIQAVDGFVLATRMEGRWTSVPVPAGMPIGTTPLATEHRDAPVEPQAELW
jgi:hypothetical protein